ncbi:hypothetical protein CWI37_0039p0010 [Hamiltosporidium tvaerminnensis]|uniref:Uncharacterized protein n=1 Tax=Hamiltosporidium tvaerminnensis TaxID=1176355 RepID=A0A4Q9LDR8_9MICR|nr:hypothetical protein CWI37_0039p0010 [Hamiltosporidium tvaerminnensis]
MPAQSQLGAFPAFRIRRLKRLNLQVGLSLATYHLKPPCYKTRKGRLRSVKRLGSGITRTVKAGAGLDNKITL